MQVGGCRMRGQGVVIGNKEETLVFFLHFNKTFQSSEIISQMQISGRANTTNNNIHLRFTILPCYLVTFLSHPHSCYKYDIQESGVHFVG